MKEENIKSEYQRKVDKSLIPTCNIMGVNIAAINMNWLLKYIDENLSDIKGDYICVSNVHTTVTSYEDAAYCAVQNGGLMAIPDGGPLSSVGRKRGYSDMDRTTGPSLMGEIFKISAEKGYRHYFYGSTEETLKLLEEKLQANYPGIQIAGMYSPPFRPLTEEEDKNIIENINKTKPDFVWIGLGAPKQEKWMAEHQGKIDGLMLGVGAGFDYYAENIKRAPEWMQKSNLEWLYRLMQDPKRLFKRYFHTNTKFIWNAMIRGKYKIRQEQVRFLQEMPSEENLWKAVIAFQEYPFKTATGLPFRYKLKVGKNGGYNRELMIDRREKSKSLAWSSVVLAFENSKRISEEVKKPKALGDIRGVSYIYPILWRFGLIRVPEAIEKKMGKQR